MDNEEASTLSPDPLPSDTTNFTEEKPLRQTLEQATDEIASFQDHHAVNSQDRMSLTKASSQELLPHVATLQSLLKKLDSFEGKHIADHDELEDFPELINLSELDHTKHQPDFTELDKTITRAALFTCAVCFGNSLYSAAISLSENMTFASATYTAGCVALTSFWARSAIKLMTDKPQKTRLLTTAAKKSSIFTSITLGAHVVLSHMFPNVVPPAKLSHSAVQVLCSCFWYFIDSVNKNKNAAIGSVEKYNLDEQSSIKSSLQDYDDRRSTFLTTLANEIEDATVMLTSTLHYFSPTRILEGSHELLTACSIPVPIASISAINTTTKQVRYISSNLSLLARLSLAQNIVEDTIERSTVQKEFDIGELLQAVGDAMAGVAAKLDVKLVIYHTDNALHYTNVVGDEDVLRHTLINLVRNLLDSCTTGSCIELGLNVTPISSDNENNTAPRLLVTFSMTLELSSNSDGSLLPNANLTSKLLYYLGGSLALENIGETDTSFIIRLELNEGTRTEKVHDVRERPHERLHRQLSNIRFSDEPTLDQLSLFVNRLSGVKVVLYATNQSIFAKHLTSCLAGWNVNISHVSVMKANEDDLYFRSTDSEVTTPGSEASAAQSSVHGTTSDLPVRPDVTSPQGEQTLMTAPATFVLIDDDVNTLEQQLHEFRAQAALVASAQSSRRHKRGKSAAHANHTTAIIHFTSLSDYKTVRDTINWFHTVSVLNPYGIPQVIVVPKPAGPRRFLTALHTAWSNAVVEPQYLPIATSPSSPMTPSSQKSIWNGGLPGSLPSPSHNAGLDDSGSSTESGLHVGRRPTSAIYSPPILPNEEGSNYFTAAGSGKVSSPSGIHAHEVQGSPTGVSTAEGVLFDPSNKGTASSVSSGSGLRTSINRYRSGSTSMVANATRRRSNTDLRGSVDGTGHINLPTGFHHPPLDQVSPGGSPLKISITASQESPSGTPSPHTTTPFTSNAVDPALAPEQTVPAPPSPTNAPVAEEVPLAGPAIATSEPVNKPIGEKSSAMSRRRRKEKVAASGVSSPPINVLIVEDNVINQAILSTWMKKHKIKFGTASNGQEALDKWNGGGYHLILMDIQLPVMDGIEATQRIRAIEKEQKTGKLTRPAVTDARQELSVFRSPVIIVALTASSLASDREAALSAGCNDFLTKPVDLVWLEKKIIEWGCMQALIDFDSWRKWKRSEATTTKKSSDPLSSTKTAETSTAATTTSKPASPQPSRSSETVTTRKGVLLPGASGIKRKGSSGQEAKSSVPARRALTRASSDPQIQTSPPPPRPPPAKSNISPSNDTRTGALSPIKESSGSSDNSTVKIMSDIALSETQEADATQSNQQEII